MDNFKWPIIYQLKFALAKNKIQRATENINLYKLLGLTK